ncbi:unnamed protein product [Caenorhabditis brenneri]
MSSAEAMAAAFEEDGGKDLSTGTGKRTKSERVEHKHSAQPGGDTRKVVQTATNGEAKRKEKWWVLGIVILCTEYQSVYGLPYINSILDSLAVHPSTILRTFKTDCP